ncbi:MAG: hypothetical protein Q9204_009209, partial [Flavoplaca sp. TL-2023a]
RLWLRKKLHQIEDHLTSLLKVIVSRAENDIDLLLPGYTHLQRAQPVRWSHWLLSYGACFARDLRALEFVIQELNYCPLGCGALSGNVFNIDRRAIADELGFKELCMNSMDAVSDRDFLLKTMGWGSDFMLHVSRIAEDLCIYSSQEFGFVKLADAYSTGSSLMPQKKNPDALELLRGKSGTMHGIHSGFRMTLNALPSTYNKDMQEGKHRSLAPEIVSRDTEPVSPISNTYPLNCQATNPVLTTKSPTNCLPVSGTSAILSTTHLLSTSTLILTGVLTTLTPNSHR